MYPYELAAAPADTDPGHLYPWALPAPLPVHISYLEPDVPQLRAPLFPTPSELLTDLAVRDAHPHRAPRTDPEPRRVESQRKARQRAIADEIGFAPTDPDSISNHEKKRHYLECLEHYVTFLHEQLRLVNAEPVALQRVHPDTRPAAGPPPNGLMSTRSMRTLLVHMQGVVKKQHLRTLDEEQVFVRMSAKITAAQQQLAQLAPLPVDPAAVRRHSVAACDGVWNDADPTGISRMYSAP